MATERLPVQLATPVLGVSESGYDEWQDRPASRRAIWHAWLTGQIQAVHLASRGTCGACRAQAEFTLGLGITIGRGAVELLMRRAGIKGLPGSRRPRPRRQTPTAGDLVSRQFTRPAPDQLWVTDITEHPTREGKVYCAVMLDACTRRVVGSSIDSTQTAALVTSGVASVRSPSRSAARRAFSQRAASHIVPLESAVSVTSSRDTARCTRQKSATGVARHRPG